MFSLFLKQTLLLTENTIHLIYSKESKRKREWGNSNVWKGVCDHEFIVHLKNYLSVIKMSSFIRIP